jgi:sugar/nucleoside kinase (ribokinase family)
MAFKYKAAILGPIPRDHITNFRGEVIEKYGGVNNPAIALAKILGDESIIYPVAHVRKKDEDAIKTILQDYSNINLDYINSSADQGDVNRLRFIDQNNRLEKMSGFMNPIVPDDVKNLLDCDVFIILPVTEFEIALETLKFIKKYSNALVIFDAHGPTTMMTALGDRLMKFWIDRDSWLPYMDVLKMNLDEAKCSWFRKKYTLSELENNYEFGFDDLRPFAKHCLNMGVKVLCVTLDGKGCVIYFAQDGELQEKLIPAIKVGKIVDTTGCGDSFAGGFAFGLLTAGDYIKAAQYANVLGAQRTQGKTFDVFKSFAETEQMRRETYDEEEKV